MDVHDILIELKEPAGCCVYTTLTRRNESKDMSLDGSTALSPSVSQEGQDVANKRRKYDGDGSKNT